MGDDLYTKTYVVTDSQMEDSTNLPDPDVIAAEPAEDLQAALDHRATAP